MNERHADRAVEQALASWMDSAAPAQAPTTLLEDTFVRTMKTEQARVYPWSRLGIGPLPSFGGSSQARIALVLVGALLVAILATAIAGGGIRLQAPPIPTPTTPSAAPSDRAQASLPAPIAIVAEARVPFEGLIALVSDGTFLWALAPGRIDRIDPATNKVTGTVALGPETDEYDGLAVNDAGLWATNFDAVLVYHVNPKTLKVVAEIPAGVAPKGILANVDGVWVADVHGGAVLRIDPATDTVIETIPVGPIGNSGPNWLADGFGSIWVDIPNNETVVRIDPITNTIQATLQTPQRFTACGGFAIGTDAVWVSGCDVSTAVARLDPATNQPVTAVTIPGHGGPTLLDDVLWVGVDTGDPATGMIVRIDQSTNQIDRVLVGEAPYGGGGGPLVVAGSVWVPDGWNSVILRFPLAAFGL